MAGDSGQLSAATSHIPRGGVLDRVATTQLPVEGTIGDFDRRNLKLLRKTLPSRGGEWTKDRYAKVPNTALGWHTTAAGAALGTTTVVATAGAMAWSIVTGGPELGIILSQGIIGGAVASLGFSLRSRHWLSLLGAAPEAEDADLVLRRAIRDRKQRAAAFSYGLAERAAGTDVECRLPEINFTWRSHGIKAPLAKSLRRNQARRQEDGNPLFFGNVWADKAKSFVAEILPSAGQAVDKVARHFSDSPDRPAKPPVERVSVWREQALIERCGVHTPRVREFVHRLDANSKHLNVLSLPTEDEELFHRSGTEIHEALDTFCALPLEVVGKPAPSGRTPTQELIATLSLLDTVLVEMVSRHDQEAVDKLSYLRRLNEDRHHRSDLD